MQWKPHSYILTCPEHKFKSWIKLIKFNIFVQSVFKQVCTLHSHIANWSSEPQDDGETTRVVLKLKRVRLFREVTEAYQFSGLLAKCLLARLRSLI